MISTPRFTKIITMDDTSRTATLFGFIFNSTAQYTDTAGCLSKGMSVARLLYLKTTIKLLISLSLDLLRSKLRYVSNKIKRFKK